MDVAFRLFLILKDGDFAIQAGRFGEALTQWIPVLGAQLELSLKTIAISYSVGVVLYYAALFLLCYFILKQAKFALLLALFNVFMVSYTFWWMQIEFAQGLALLIVFFAWLKKEKTLTHFYSWKGIVLLALLHTLFYFHPLLPIVLVFFLFFFWRELDNRLLYFIIGFIVLEYTFKYLLLGNSGYDNVAMKGLNNFRNLYPHYFDIPANRQFFRYCWTDYYFLLPTLLASIIFYIKQQQKRKLWMVLSFFISYLLLINVSNFKGMAQFHIESFYLPLSLFVLCPLVFDLLPKISSKQWLFIGLLLVFSIRIYHIYQLHPKYSARVTWYENLIEDSKTWKQQKVIFPNSVAPVDTLWQTWASSQEIWLLSSLKYPDNPSSITISPKAEKFHWALKRNTSFITEWELFPYETLPKQYFNFRDTSRYVIYKD